MDTQKKDLAIILGAVIWADGVYAEEEKVAVAQVAEALELGDDFVTEVDNQVAAMESMDEEALNDALANACENAVAEEASMIVEAVLQVIVCDGILSHDEVNTLIAISEALGVDTADTILLLCDLVKEEEIVIDLD